MRMVGFYRW